ncbi:MAG: damage-inducible protein CinA, partial [Bacteroidales bacterium]|nr:damage-inducible protein CinA [Bacteroidales bacterium]
MNVEIINIGDELLIGQVVNTNCSYMSKALNNAGIDVGYITVVGDNYKAIEQAVTAALHRADAVLITGGLGPTKDD